MVQPWRFREGPPRVEHDPSWPEQWQLAPGKTNVDATSGNTGIAYAMIGAALGYPVKLFLPHSASHERKRILAAYGAES